MICVKTPNKHNATVARVPTLHSVVKMESPLAADGAHGQPARVCDALGLARKLGEVAFQLPRTKRGTKSTASGGTSSAGDDAAPAAEQEDVSRILPVTGVALDCGEFASVMSIATPLCEGGDVSGGQK